MTDPNQIDTLLGILETVSEPVISYNEKMRITWMNPAAELMVGLSLERARGLSCADIMPEELPCRGKKCPVMRAMVQWEIASWGTDGLSSSDTIVTAVPLLQSTGNRRVLEVIQDGFMQIREAPFKDMAWDLVNRAFSLSEAVPGILKAVREAAGPVTAGVYIHGPEGYSLMGGLNTFPEIEFIRNLVPPSEAPLYIDAKKVFPGVHEDRFPDGVSLLPVFSDGRPRALLFCGTVPDRRGQEHLETLQSVVGTAMKRLLAGEEYSEREPG